MYDLQYIRPATLAEALALRGRDDAAAYLGGGQTLLPVLRARLAAPSRLIDIGRLAELRSIRRDGDRLVIGAGETHAAVAASPHVAEMAPALARLAGGIGDPMIRHRGTLGGSIANNDPAACYPAAALALEAVIVTDRRAVTAAEFFTGMFTTALADGEIVTGVSFPSVTGAHYAKFLNPASRFALIGVFVALLPGGARVAVTGGGTGAFRWTAAEAAIDVHGATATLDQVALADDHFSPDLHGGVAYRQQLTRAMARRALHAITS